MTRFSPGGNLENALAKALQEQADSLQSAAPDAPTVEDPNQLGYVQSYDNLPADEALSGESVHEDDSQVESLFRQTPKDVLDQILDADIDDDELPPFLIKKLEAVDIKDQEAVLERLQEQAYKEMMARQSESAGAEPAKSGHQKAAAVAVGQVVDHSSVSGSLELAAEPAPKVTEGPKSPSTPAKTTAEQSPSPQSAAESADTDTDKIPAHLLDKYNAMSNDEILTVAYGKEGSERVKAMSKTERDVYLAAQAKVLAEVQAELGQLGNFALLLRAEQAAADDSVSPAMKEVINRSANRVQHIIQGFYDLMPASEMIRLTESNLANPDSLKSMSAVEQAIASRRHVQAVAELQDKYKHMSDKDILWLDHRVKDDQAIVDKMSQFERELASDRINLAYAELTKNADNSAFKDVELMYKIVQADRDAQPSGYLEWLDKYYKWRNDQENAASQSPPTGPISVPKPQPDPETGPIKIPAETRTPAEVMAAQEQERLLTLSNRLDFNKANTDQIRSLSDAELAYVIDYIDSPKRYAELWKEYHKIEAKQAKPMTALMTTKKALAKARARHDAAENRLEQIRQERDTLVNTHDVSMGVLQRRKFRRELAKRQNAQEKLNNNIYKLRDQTFDYTKNKVNTELQNQLILGIGPGKEQELSKRALDPASIYWNRYDRLAFDKKILETMTPEMFRDKIIGSKVYNRLTLDGRNRYDELEELYIPKQPQKQT